MNYAMVQELAARHFGPPHGSLTLGKSKKQPAHTHGDPPNEYYYYYLENEEEMLAIAELLQAGFADKGIPLPKLTRSFPQKSPPQCARLAAGDGGWNLAIYNVVGVTYHRTTGGKTAATLRLHNMPTVSLCDSNPDFYGYFEPSWFSRSHTPAHRREGVCYWVNKAMKTSDRFREFSADFFSTAAQETGLGILQNAATAIRRWGCFLPPVSYQDLLASRTPADLLRRVSTGTAPPAFSPNSVDLNTAYVMQTLTPLLQPQEVEQLTALDAKTLSAAVTLPQFYGEFQPQLFLTKLYASLFQNQL